MQGIIIVSKSEFLQGTEVANNCEGGKSMLVMVIAKRCKDNNYH